MLLLTYGSKIYTLWHSCIVESWCRKTPGFSPFTWGTRSGQVLTELPSFNDLIIRQRWHAAFGHISSMHGWWTRLLVHTRLCISASQHEGSRQLVRRPRPSIFSERELMFMFAICRRPSVCLSSVCLSVCLSSVTFVHPTQPIEIFGNVSAPCNTMVTWQHPGKILRRSSQGNPSVGGLNQRVVEKFSDVGPLRDYISETVQDMR